MPPGLAPAAHLHLGLHDDGVAERVGHFHRLRHGGDGRSRRHGDAVAREQQLALVLEQIHEGPSGEVGANRG